MIYCVLCGEHATHYFTDVKRSTRYLHCGTCDLRFLHPQDRLSKEREDKRYLQHNNLVDDPRYQLFVDPLYQLIRSKVPLNSVCLDFGCGPGPVLTHLLSRHHYDVTLFDPLFVPNQEALKKKYDLVFAVEVVEHFYSPAQEFIRLRELLVSSGSLAIMTYVYSDKVNFETWTYRYDPTHVCFYSRATFEWIQSRYQFKTLKQYSERIVWFDVAP